MFSFSKHDVNGEDEESLPPPPPTHPPPADSVYTTETSVTPSGASESCCTDSGDDSDEDSSESDSESEASEQDEKSNVIDKEGDEGEEAGDIDLEKQPLGIPSNKPREESAVDKDTIDEIIEYEYDEESRTSRNKLYVALIAGLLLVIAVVWVLGTEPAPLVAIRPIAHNQVPLQQLWYRPCLVRRVRCQRLHLVALRRPNQQLQL